MVGIAKSAFRAALVCLSFSSLDAFALPKPGVPLPNPEISPFLGSLDGATYDFEGITKLSNCSGSLVRFESSQGSDNAMVLTNGHCVASSNGGMMRPNTFMKDVKTTRTFTFLTPSGDLSQYSVASTKVLYATMTGTDMALYEVGTSFDTIEKKYSVQPLTISSTRPKAGESIEILSGYWRRGYSCKIDTFIYQLKEAGYVWNDSLRYTEGGCQTIHGTSGSPIIAAGTKEVIGVNNTGSDDGQECTMNNPCEVTESGEISYKKGLSYGQQTYIIYSCLNAKGAIDLDMEGCLLYH
jgi:V8-like Glu-specific endopeptidase